MNICVVGAGAIGGWVAARLALAGETVADALIGKAVEAILERCALALIAAVI